MSPLEAFRRYHLILFGGRMSDCVVHSLLIQPEDLQTVIETYRPSAWDKPGHDRMASYTVPDASPAGDANQLLRPKLSLPGPVKEGSQDLPIASTSRLEEAPQVFETAADAIMGDVAGGETPQPDPFADDTTGDNHTAPSVHELGAPTSPPPAVSEPTATTICAFDQVPPTSQLTDPISEFTHLVDTMDSIKEWMDT
jgi:hypothetical protein